MNNDEREKVLNDLVKIATDGYAENIDLGRMGLVRTKKAMEEVSDDKELIRAAILRSPYATDPDFEGLAGALVLF